jgi:plasmid stabilization system protein ParE
MIRYTPEALDDYERLYDWLADRDARLCDRFVATLRQTETRIAKRPLMFPLASGGETRKCLMRFGRRVYVIYFVEDGDDQIIVRMWHGREERR